ncbi:MAG: TVP38/TMEM64 family protein [Sandaracinaceae bacterium]
MTEPTPTPAEPVPGEQETVVDEKAVLKRRLRIAGVVLLFVGSIAVAKLTGLDAYLDRETVRTFMVEAGPLGFFAFLGIFAVGELLHVPGWVFVGAATLAYGQPLAAVAAYSGALVSVTVSFFVVRAIGGQSLSEIKRPIVRRIMAKLEEHPIRTVALLRLILWVTPALNYALAMSKLRFRDYFLGSALGLLLPMPLMSLFINEIVALFE